MRAALPGFLKHLDEEEHDVNVSDRAREGLEDLAGEVSVSALLEALGQTAADGIEDLLNASVLKRAAEIAGERRSRRID